jgi:SNF2 family DNA or RNA helicase
LLSEKQQIAVNFINQNNNRAIDADRAGLGKTYTVLSAIENTNNHPTLIICIKPGLYVWENELQKWFNQTSIIYTGNPKQRQLTLQEIQENGPKYVIANYSFFNELMQLLTPRYFKTLVLDEYHMYGLLNRKTKMYESVKKVCKIIPHIIPITGTPMRQTCADYYPALSLVDPTNIEFKSFWRFVDKYCVKIKDMYGYKIERLPANRYEFYDMLSKYVIRRTGDDQLPKKTRQPIPVEMSKEQQKMFKQLQEEMILDYNGSLILTPNEMVKILRCRQLLVSPETLDIKAPSGGIDAIIDIVKDEEEAVIIFTPFRNAAHIIDRHLKENIKGIQTFIIHGGMTQQQLRDAQEGFQTLNSKNKAVICTIKSGASMTLTDAKVAIFLGYEWGAEDNNQAEGRIHRLTQDRPVRCLYLLYKNTPDEKIIQRLNDKQMAFDVSMPPEQYYEYLLDKKD